MVSEDTTGHNGGWPLYAQVQSRLRTIEERAGCLLQERPFAALLAAAAAGYFLGRIAARY